MAANESSFPPLERNNGAAFRKENFPAPYHAVEHPVAGRFMVTVDKGGPVSCHVFMLHGGGYVAEAMPEHGDKVRAMADKGLRVTAFAYPLAPENDIDTMHKAIDEAYYMIRKLYPEDQFAIYGDSAGGALALCLAMRLRDRQETDRPGKLILVSPALSMALDNPDIAKYKANDISLNHEFLISLTDVIVRGEDKHEVKFTPLNGNHDNLGDILMFFGEGEILRPDGEIFAAEKPEGTRIRLVIAPAQFHDYLLLVGTGNAEAIKAFNLIQEFLQ